MGYNQDNRQLVQGQVTSQQDTEGGSIADQLKKCSNQKILSHQTISTVEQRDQSSNLKEPTPRTSKSAENKGVSSHTKLKRAGKYHV